MTDEQNRDTTEAGLISYHDTTAPTNGTNGGGANDGSRPKPKSDVKMEGFEAHYVAPTKMPHDVPDTGRKTYTMAGYDDFDNIVDYIKKTTYTIWDLKHIGMIYRFYTPTTIVHTSDGDTFGRDTVIANSLTKMAAFPDIRDYITDVIWAGSDQEGYRTSMRWTWTARNTGYSIYGPPTGKRVVVSGMANCVIMGEQVVQEWVVYNELSLIRQLGLDIHELLARQTAPQPLVVGKAPAAGEVNRLDGQAKPQGYVRRNTTQGFDIEDFVRSTWHEIWNERMFGNTMDYYAPNYICHTASDRELYGVGDLTQDIMARVAAFPDAAMHIDDLYWLDEGHGRYRVATLWTMTGTHTGPSIYGPPTGRRARVMGITHQIVVDGRYVEEWTEYGEFNLLKQLYAPLT